MARLGNGLPDGDWSATLKRRQSHREIKDPTMIQMTVYAAAPANQGQGYTRLSGTALVPAYACQYGDIQADDLLRVNFDVNAVRVPGLYLVESDDNAGWMGCRRLDVLLSGGVVVDQTGSGDWARFPAGIRVVGYVEQVYKLQ